MKVFVTGSTGFVGSHLMETYNNVYGYKREQNIEEELNCYKPDIIINSAAEIYDAEKMFEPNIVLTYKCLEYVKKHPEVKMIHIGSSSEYGPKETASAECDKLDPIDFYQGSKAAATLMCQGFARHYKLNIAIARPYSVYGPKERPHRLFPRLWKAFKNNAPMTLYAGEHDFIYISDFIRGINILINKNVPSGDVVNFGTGVQWSNLDVLRAFEKVTNRRAPVEYINEKLKPFESSVWRCNIDYARKQYKFLADIDLHTGVYLFLKQANY